MTRPARFFFGAEGEWYRTVGSAIATTMGFNALMAWTPLVAMSQRAARLALFGARAAHTQAGLS